jgi:acetyl esterase/lipase
VTVLADVDYGHGRLLDLYLPEGDRTPPLPLLIWSHGSGFRADNGRTGADLVAERLGPYGLVVAGVTLPGTRTHTFPAQLDAVRDAVAFLRRRAVGWQLDPTRFAAMGESSGGWAAAMAGLATDGVRAVVSFYPPTDLAAMNDHAREVGLVPSERPGRPDGRGVLPARLAMDHDSPDSPESRLIGGPLREHLDVARTASPVHYVRPGAPPFLILHGELDPLVPWPQGRVLAEALAGAGASVELIRLPHAGHAVWRTWLDDPALKANARRIVGRDGRLTDAGPVDPTWDLVADFLTRHGVLSAQPRP